MVKKETTDSTDDTGEVTDPNGDANENQEQQEQQEHEPSAEPVEPVEVEFETELEEKLASWKAFSRKHEQEKKESLARVKDLETKLEGFSDIEKELQAKDERIAELEGQAFAQELTTILSEFSLPEEAAELITAKDSVGARAQAEKLASIAGAGRQSSFGVIPNQGSQQQQQITGEFISEKTELQNYLKRIRR